MEFQPSRESYAGVERPTARALRTQIAGDRAELRRSKGAKAKQLRARIAAELKQIERIEHHTAAKKNAKSHAGATPIGPELTAAIAKVKGRIKKEKALIAKTKREVAAASGAAVAAGLLTLGAGAVVGAGIAAGLATKLHRTEKLLHRDRHLLTVLHAAAAGGDKKAIAVATSAAKTAAAGRDPGLVVAGYPQPVTPEPTEKPIDQIVDEAHAEAADPSGATAEANNDAAAGEPSAAGEAPTTTEEAKQVDAAAAGAGGDLVELHADTGGNHHQGKGRQRPGSAAAGEGSSSSGMLIGAIALGGAGLGLYLYNRNKKPAASHV